MEGESSTGSTWTGLRQCFSSVCMCLLVTSYGCVTHYISIDATIPKPLVEPLALHMGVFYSQTLRDYKYTEENKQGEKWILPIGAASVMAFETMLPAMFEKTQSVESVTADNVAGLDAILEPSIIDTDVLTPEETNSKFYQVTIEYKMRLLSTQGELLAEWPLTAYGKDRVPLLKKSESLRRASIMALRDGEALFALRFQDEPDVSRWLQAKGAIRYEAGSEAYPGAYFDHDNNTRNDGNLNETIVNDATE